VLLAVAAAARQRPVIAIEEPVSARLLFALAPLALKLLPVACDDQGPQPERLREALAQGASAFVYQTRHHNPLGHSVGRRRRDALARVLQSAPDVAVIEDDFLGPLADAPLHSLGERLPGRVVLVRGYCTAFGIDLKTALVGGPVAAIQQIDKERVHGMATHSRLLQGALAHLLASSAAGSAVARAHGAYRARAALLRQALHARGVEVHGGDTLVLWVTVHDEVRTLVALAGQGASGGAGSQCFVTAGTRNRLRIAVTQLPDDPARIDELADAIAQAEGGEPGESYRY
ncbi:MAG TPA: GntR family transcriptional regulator, partial [Pseudorhodoferax sp.]|nr:GntR family transcriptional regulator [Pseudorhodoferax sp.]